MMMPIRFPLHDADGTENIDRSKKKRLGGIQTGMNKNQVFDDGKNCTID